MAPVVKASRPQTGDKTKLGDAHTAWESCTKDDDHGHYCVFTYDGKTDRIAVYKSGADKGNSSAHDEVMVALQELYAKNEPAWYGYTFKAVVNDKPGQKDHAYKYVTGFCMGDKGFMNAKKCREIKNRVQSVVLTPSDCHLEINHPDKLDSDHYFERLRGAMGSAKYADFGGDHKHTNEKSSEQIHRESVHNDRQKNKKNKKEQLYASVDSAADAEKTRRCSELAKKDQEANRQRAASMKMADQMMDEEKKRRIKEEGGLPSNGQEARNSMIKQQLLDPKNMHKLENKQRASARIHVSQLANQRHDEMKRELRDKDAAAEAERKSNQKAAWDAAGAEQARRSQHAADNMNNAYRAREFASAIKQDLHDAHEIMDQALAERNGKIKADLEQYDQRKNQKFASPQAQKQKHKMQQELKQKGGKKK